MKGVFDTKPHSGYDDETARHYRFPRQYRAITQKLVGDWIVYWEPRRIDVRQAYVAVAPVLRVDPDSQRHGHSYAVMAASSFCSTGSDMRRSPRRFMAH